MIMMLIANHKRFSEREASLYEQRWDIGVTRIVDGLREKLKMPIPYRQDKQTGHAVATLHISKQQPMNREQVIAMGLVVRGELDAMFDELQTVCPTLAQERYQIPPQFPVYPKGSNQKDIGFFVLKFFPHWPEEENFGTLETVTSTLDFAEYRPGFMVNTATPITPIIQQAILRRLQLEDEAVTGSIYTAVTGPDRDCLLILFPLNSTGEPATHDFLADKLAHWKECYFPAVTDVVCRIAAGKWNKLRCGAATEYWHHDSNEKGD
jgi:hypothetical protein